MTTEARHVTSLHFTDGKELALIKKAAKLAGTTASSILREAAVKEAERIIARRSGKCPTCGHQRSAAA
jgi:uncharacterized protein (DUF1778 family)